MLENYLQDFISHLVHLKTVAPGLIRNSITNSDRSVAAV